VRKGIVTMMLLTESLVLSIIRFLLQINSQLIFHKRTLAKGECS